MIEQRWVSVLLVIVLVALFGVANTKEAQGAEAGGPCMPNAVSPSQKCPVHYACKSNKCECAWGKLEVGWLLGSQGYEKGTYICDLLGSGNGVNVVWNLLGVVVTAVIALTVMAALVSIVIGGYIYMTAGGNADRVRTAKVWIGSAILGIILALMAWVILNSIASNLV